MKKDFDSWNKVKQKTDEAKSSVYFKTQEVWWIKSGLNIGIESNGKGKEYTRPVLIIKKHNRNSCLVASLTTSAKEDKSKILIDPQKHPCMFVNISQIKTIDSKRLVRKMFFLDQTNFERVKTKIKEFNDL